MSESSVITQLIASLKDEQSRLATGTMNHPPEGEFKLGQATGRYQGLQQALDLLDGILRDANARDQD